MDLEKKIFDAINDNLFLLNPETRKVGIDCAVKVIMEIIKQENNG